MNQQQDSPTCTLIVALLISWGLRPHPARPYFSHVCHIGTLGMNDENRELERERESVMNVALCRGEYGAVGGGMDRKQEFEKDFGTRC